MYSRKLYYLELPITRDRNLTHTGLNKREIYWLMWPQGSLGAANLIIKFQSCSFCFSLCWCHFKAVLLPEVVRWLPAAPDLQPILLTNLGSREHASAWTWNTVLELSVFGSDWSGLCHMLTLEAGAGVSSAWSTWQRREGIISQWNSSVVKEVAWG